MERRQFIGATAAALYSTLVSSAETPPDLEKLARDRLRLVMPSRQKIADFVNPHPDAASLERSRGWMHDAELGWVLRDAVRPDGIDGSKTFYHYEADGARRIVNAADKPSRIHSYGDSFTHGDQVSDGETWQEFIAAHFQEPIRNYGVGGYSVYQAYRRMKRIEERSSAKYVILNIYSYDHYRNLSPWWAITGVTSPHDVTLPHLRVYVGRDECTEFENPLPKPHDLEQLCDEDFVWNTFKDEPVLLAYLAINGDEARAKKLIDPLAAKYGIDKEKYAAESAVQTAQQIHTAAALFATRRVVQWTEKLLDRLGKKLLVILSYSSPHVQAVLNGQPRFDRELLDWLLGKPYPVIDLMDAFRADYARSNGDVAAFLNRYFNGHHSPAGNFFFASSIREQLIRWLDPPPLPYR